MPLAISPDHKDTLVEVLARTASDPFSTPQEVFRNLVASSHLPPLWTRALAGRWNGDPDIDARKLVDWAELKDVNSDDPRYTALGSVLLALLRKPLAPADIRTTAAIIHVDGLILDQTARAQFAMQYRIPFPSAGEQPSGAYGPEIDWLGPQSDVELQSFFRPDPPWLDVGFLRTAIARAAAVCLVENGSVTGTGCLVAPTRVLTNYHVLCPKPGDDPAAAVANLVLRFGSFTVADGVSAGKPFKPVTLLDSSPPGKLDFALLEVDPKIQGEEEIKPAPISPGLPAAGAALNILHHPAGGGMKLSTSANGVTGVYEDRGYVQYATAAIGGSSGSPCFNDSWDMVALHHAQRARPVGSVREGILMRTICQQAKAFLPSPSKP